MYQSQWFDHFLATKIKTPPLMKTPLKKQQGSPFSKPPFVRNEKPSFSKPPFARNEKSPFSKASFEKPPFTKPPLREKQEVGPPFSKGASRREASRFSQRGLREALLVSVEGGLQGGLQTRNEKGEAFAFTLKWALLPKRISTFLRRLSVMLFRTCFATKVHFLW